MPHSAVATDSLTAALDGLVDRVHGAEFAVVLVAGRAAARCVPDVEDKLAEHISSVVAGLQSLGLATVRTCGGGGLRQVVVQMSRAFLFVATTRSGAILTVRISGDAEVGDMAYEVALFVGQAEQHLPVYLEPASATAGGDTGADHWPA
ncbi:roadblock/LC7 domain-containing protein [Micromonospora sp. ATA32]|nr:roadblock/LC7 domain-containing protein [Micromonospora sp. ATA32]